MAGTGENFGAWAGGTLNDSAFGLGQGLLDGRLGDLINLFVDSDLPEGGTNLNHALEERSYLEFYFNDRNADWASNEGNVRRIPFFENPEIQETRSPIYAKTQIVARNEPVRLYVGTDARKVSLKFNMTFPHILEFYKISNFGPGWQSDLKTSYINMVKEQAQLSLGSRYTSIASTSKNTSPAQSGGLAGMLGDLGRQFDESSAGQAINDFLGGSEEDSSPPGAPEDGGNLSVTWSPNDGVGPQMDMESLQWGGSDPKGSGYDGTTFQGSMGDGMLNPVATSLAAAYGMAITNPGLMVGAFMQYVIDTIKASVLGVTRPGDSSKSAGPPIVRFRHGTNFLEEPFIVTNYSIDYDNSAGVDPRTLLPRRMFIRLSLEEFRQKEGAGDAAGVPDASDILNLNNWDRGSAARNPHKY
tara:strand:- start:18 stop:1259 length:1242 start_codon:yes stop_codon:yes gene_type:complete